ncbi:alpha/beta fold hydrolase [Nocardioides daejeonensis]|uniref:alpha/beta fold hydrolase n=1 Tax=Nocardioides daejeonensis TaxID=1046556 RepID=UPI00194F4ED1|nr:alpha/beta hydrolase [Nocardioides daejeonensis]
MSAMDLVRRVHLPWAPLPAGRMLDLPGRGGATWITDTPGPTPEAPAVVLLHALATTGLLTWYPSIPTLAARYRVITLDQRCHGRGITTRPFTLEDCADDVAALLDTLGLEQAVIGGYSMGSIVAQRVWRQHPQRVRGLVLGATTDRFMTTARERIFHQATGATMRSLRSLPLRGPALPPTEETPTADLHTWALAEMRATSPLAVGQAVAALGRHHSRPWLGRVDVPTAVVVTLHDKVIPPHRQIALARRIPGATVHEIAAGHAAVVREAERFVPAFAQAVHTVHARARS